MATRMTRRWTLGLLGPIVAANLAAGQVVEREQDTKITGPRGRTIERDIKVERGPGFVDRQVEIKRPGETIIRDTRIQTGPGGGGGRGYSGPVGRSFGGPGPGFHGGPRYIGGPRFVENVIVQRPPVFAGVVGLPALSFFFGGAAPPPVVVASPPVYGAPPAPVPPPAFDAFADAVGRLKSFHGSSRRDGALALGRIGDPRAIPALNERLEHDFDKDVRVAAAVALGQIGDERGAVALEKAVLYDKRHEVRDAAKLALQSIPKPGEASSRPTIAIPGRAGSPVPALPPSRTEVLDPGPNPNESAEPPLEDRPPPPPVPMPSGPGRNPS